RLAELAAEETGYGNAKDKLAKNLLAADLLAAGVQKVTVESTSDYWRIWFYLLEAAGLDVALVNAREVKNVPGRAKTDRLDAVWLAKLTERGMLRPSFVPPAPV
ncbi:IS110 family transposase, partial [Klebsiella pneumoniae]|uniref:IS110 family transposase n=1 Tax=Klebsiella pneumoniae TaxID=573 RepID=UPI003A8C7E97